MTSYGSFKYSQTRLQRTLGYKEQIIWFWLVPANFGVLFLGYNEQNPVIMNKKGDKSSIFQ